MVVRRASGIALSKLIPNPEYEQAELERAFITYPSMKPHEYDPWPLRFRVKDQSELMRRLENNEEIVSLSVPSYIEVP
jgi:hypothetical protein